MSNHSTEVILIKLISIKGVEYSKRSSTLKLTGYKKEENEEKVLKG